MTQDCRCLLNLLRHFAPWLHRMQPIFTRTPTNNRCVAKINNVNGRTNTTRENDLSFLFDLGLGGSVTCPVNGSWSSAGFATIVPIFLTCSRKKSGSGWFLGPKPLLTVRIHRGPRTCPQLPTLDCVLSRLHQRRVNCSEIRPRTCCDGSIWDG